MSEVKEIKVNEKRSYPELACSALAEEDYVPTEEDWQDYEIWLAQAEQYATQEEFEAEYYDKIAGNDDIDSDNVLLQFTGR